MRIAFDARYINDRYHGIGRYAYRLVEALIAAAPQHQFILYRGEEQDSRFGWESLAEKPNVEIQPGPWPLYWPQEQVSWLRVLRKSRVDLFHTPYFVVPLFSRVPIIQTVHDLIFDRYPAYMPMSWSRPYYRLLMRWGTRRAQRIVAVSDFTADELTRFYNTPAIKITTVPEGVDPVFQQIPDAVALEAVRQRYGLMHPFFLSVGARRPHKNLGNLVRAFAGVAQDAPHDLVLVGPPDPRFPDEARQAADSCGINGRIRFLDFVPESDLCALYLLSNTVVLPSIVEGFGLPALEAMACGKPVLAANNSSLPEVVGDTGLLFDPKDVAGLSRAMRQLVHDWKRRQRFGRVGRRRATCFTWENAAARILDLYDEALGK
jgi:glycosyltransferase involved in cell wall biosynthesis